MTIACAIGCEDWFSRDAAILTASSFEIESSNTSISLNSSLPSVNVPVLSKITAFMPFISSTYVLPLIKTPFLVAEVIADTIPTGVEIRNAQGHEITNRESAL